MTEQKIKQLTAKFLKLAAEEFSNHGCNDVDKEMWEGWTKEERENFVYEYESWNSNGEDYEEGIINLPNYAIMHFLAHKLEQP